MYNINTDLNTNYVQIKLNITLGRFQKQLDYVRNSRTTFPKKERNKKKA